MEEAKAECGASRLEVKRLAGEVGALSGQLSACKAEASAAQATASHIAAEHSAQVAALEQVCMQTVHNNNCHRSNNNIIKKITSFHYKD